MRGWLWIAPMLVAAGWSQSREPIPTIVPETPVGGFVVPSGTKFTVRIDEPLSSERNQAGDRFTATLMDPVMVNGTVVIPMGTRVNGHVLANRQGGIFKGRAKLVLGLDSFQLSGRTFSLRLTAATFANARPHKRPEDPDPNANSVTGTRVEVTIPAETVVHFTLGKPVLV